MPLASFVRSFIFVPYQMTQRDGPILEVGWTLSYEMFFYLVVGVLLILVRADSTKNKPASQALSIAVIVISAIPLIGYLLRIDNYVFIFYTSTLLWEFVLGVMAYSFYSSFTRRVPNLRPSRYRSLAINGLVILAVAALLTIMAWFDHSGNIVQNTRFIYFGIPATLILLGLVFLEWNTSSKGGWKLLTKMGDASYALYLTHPFVTVGLTRVIYPALGWDEHRFGSTGLVLLALTLGLSIAAALLVHTLIERPLHVRLRRRFHV